MVAIVACPSEQNQVFEELPLKGSILEYALGHFIALLCVQCRCIMWIEKDAIKKDGDIWTYIK